MFWKNQGHDHFVINGLTAFHLLGVKVIKFLGGPCQNCTVLSIETTPGLYGYDRRYGNKWWYASPYPSSFHWNENMLPEKVPWRVRSQERDFFIFCIGSVKTLTAESTKLRRVLYNQCNDENAASSCMWHQISHASNGMINGTDLMTMYLRSTFCLCPPGDSFTRKAIFDSLLAGCIPVIFYRESMTQYFWHIKEKEVRHQELSTLCLFSLLVAQVEDVAVYIKLSTVSGENKNFISILKAIPPEEIKRKQVAISDLAPRLQYSIVRRV